MAKYSEILDLHKNVESLRADLMKTMYRHPISVRHLAKRLDINFLTLYRFLEKKTIPQTVNLIKIARYVEAINDN